MNKLSQFPLYVNKFGVHVLKKNLHVKTLKTNDIINLFVISCFISFILRFFKLYHNF